MEKRTLADVMADMRKFYKGVAECDCPGAERAQGILDQLEKATTPAEYERITDDRCYLQCSECGSHVEEVVVLGDETLLQDSDTEDQQPLAFCRVCLLKAVAL